MLTTCAKADVRQLGVFVVCVFNAETRKTSVQ
jgi:hypothetical protein